jgi:hypothetical protein
MRYFALAALAAVVVVATWPASARVFDRPNSGYCPDGRRVGNLKACNRANAGTRSFIPGAPTGPQARSKRH